jgi:hypothetical protein
VQPLLDAVVDYPAVAARRPGDQGHRPEDRRAEVDVRKASDDEPLSMLAFKIMDDPFVGSLTFCRIYSGKLNRAWACSELVADKKERIGRMLLMHANNREDIKEAYAGDIVAWRPEGHDAPATRCAIREAGHPRAHGIPRAGHRDRDRAEDQGRPGKDGRRAAASRAEDPSFRVSTDQESGQTIIKGMGELHLDIKVDPEARPSRSKPTSARRRWPTAKRSRRRSTSTTPTRSRPVVRASSPASRSCSSRTNRFGLRVRPSKIVGGGSEGIHPGRRKGPEVGHEQRSARRLPDDRLQGRR